MRIIQSKGNRRQYVIIAQSFRGRTNNSGAAGTLNGTFHDAHVTFYARDGSTLVADAPRAMIDQTAKTVTLLGGVHARNSAGVRLQCDRLVYDRTTELVHGAGHVKITSPDGTQASGSTFVSNVTLTSATMQ
jgi:lipopolysaccharide assembly outer membrane protein LptD (OstA)